MLVFCFLMEWSRVARVVVRFSYSGVTPPVWVSVLVFCFHIEE